MAFALLCGGASLGSEEIDFTNRDDFKSEKSDNGAVTLKWRNTEGETLTLQQAAGENFTSPSERYVGKDNSSVISGLAEGTHFFRIGRAEANEWSPPLEVVVEFFPRGKLSLLLILGGIVVISTIGTIVAGWLKTNSKGGEI